MLLKNLIIASLVGLSAAGNAGFVQKRHQMRLHAATSLHRRDNGTTDATANNNSNNNNNLAPTPAPTPTPSTDSTNGTANGGAGANLAVGGSQPPPAPITLDANANGTTTPAPDTTTTPSQGLAPVDDRDLATLQFAQMLEQAESAFFKQVPSQEAFDKAGFKDWVRNRILEIGSHERLHNTWLKGVLGDKSMQPCEYDFGVSQDDVVGFLNTIMLFEGVGTSAYLGALAALTSRGYVNAAATITTNEARHASWIQAVLHTDPFGSAFDTPLGANLTYSLVAPLIKKCPDSNAKLPLVPFPKLTIDPAQPALGTNVTLRADAGTTNVTVTDGQVLGVISAGGSISFSTITAGQAQLPDGVYWGRNYLVLLKPGSTAISDDTVLAGPAVTDILKSSGHGAYFSNMVPARLRAQ